MKRLIRFGTEVTGAHWEEAARRWRVETTGGTVTGDLLVMASGFLSTPSTRPSRASTASRGHMFHSAGWDHGHDLAGERVAVIGTGASAVQFVPQIQPHVAHLTVFQRTPPWVVPGPTAPSPPRSGGCSGTPGWPCGSAGPGSTGPGSSWW